MFFKKIPINVFFAVFLLISGLLCYTNLTNGHNWGDDFSAYIMQAKSIVEGKPLDFIEANRFTVEQSSHAVGPTAYPWGFPVLLAPIYAIFGLNILALKSVSVVCFLLFISLLWFSFCKYHSGYWRIIFFCLFAFNPVLISFLDNVLSDIPFLLFSTISVILIGTVIVEKQQLFSRVLDHILLGFVITAAYFVRTNGIALLITLAITQLIILLSNYPLQKHNHADCLTPIKSSLFQIKHKTLNNLCINLLPYATFIILLLSWSSFLPHGGSSHISILNKISLITIRNMFFYNMTLPAHFFDSFQNKYIISIIYATTIPPALSGVIRRWRSDFHIIIYIALTVLLYSLWPARQGLRFLFPILPFYFSFVLTSLERFTRSGSGIGQSIYKIVCAIPIVMVLLFAYFAEKGAYANVSRNKSTSDGPYTEISKTMFQYISNNIEPTSTVVFFKPRVMRMMTGRKSLMIDKQEELIRGDYLCFYSRIRDYNQISKNDIENLIAKKYIELVFINNDFKIYKLSKSYKNAKP